MSVHIGDRTSTSAILNEPGMRLRGRWATPPADGHQDICLLVGRLFDALGRLKPQDQRIAEAVCRTGNLRAAARLLKPGCRHYRSFLQRKIKEYRRMLARLIADRDLALLFVDLDRLSRSGRLESQ